MKRFQSLSLLFFFNTLPPLPLPKNRKNCYKVKNKETKTYCVSSVERLSSTSACTICSSSCLSFVSRCSGVSPPKSLLFMPLSENELAPFPCACCHNRQNKSNRPLILCFQPSAHIRRHQ